MNPVHCASVRVERQSLCLGGLGKSSVTKLDGHVNSSKTAAYLARKLSTKMSTSSRITRGNDQGVPSPWSDSFRDAVSDLQEVRGEDHVTD